MCPKPFSLAKKKTFFSDGKSRGPLLVRGALKCDQHQQHLKELRRHTIVSATGKLPDYFHNPIDVFITTFCRIIISAPSTKQCFHISN